MHAYYNTAFSKSMGLTCVNLLKECVDQEVETSMCDSDVLIIDASAFRYRPNIQHAKTKAGLKKALYESYVRPFSDGPQCRVLIFMFDDYSKHVKARTDFLQNVRNRRPKPNISSGPIIDEHYDIAEMLNNGRAAQFAHVVAECILEFNDNSDENRFYVRTPTLASEQFTLCNGAYHTSLYASNTSPTIDFEGFHYGEVDIESHKVAQSCAFGRTHTIISNDGDHYLLSLTFNNPDTSVVKSIRKNKATMYNASDMLGIFDTPDLRATAVLALILTGTDTCRFTGVSPKKTELFLQSIIDKTFDKQPLIIDKSKGRAAIDDSGKGVLFSLDVYALTEHLICHKTKMFKTETKPIESLALLENIAVFRAFWTFLYFHGLPVPDIEPCGPDIKQFPCLRQIFGNTELSGPQFLDFKIDID
jgi:hypothetical protein